MLPRMQKLKRKFEDMREIAYKYFSMLSIFNDFKLTEREIELLSHIAVSGHIGSVNSKKEFMKQHNTSINTINNIISKLYRKHLLVKIDKKVRINPAIKIDFQEPREKFIFVFSCLYQKELTKE